ncbi:MAG: putative membrane protein, partial [Patiriisocius sp.]
MQETVAEAIKDTSPFFTNDTIVFGILMVSLGLIFYTSSKKKGFWKVFYSVVPALFMAYLIPALFTTFGIIAPEWNSVSDTGVVTEGGS